MQPMCGASVAAWRMCVARWFFWVFLCFPLIITEHFVHICWLSFRDYCGMFCFFDFVLLLQKFDVKDWVKHCDSDGVRVIIGVKVHVQVWSEFSSWAVYMYISRASQSGGGRAYTLPVARRGVRHGRYGGCPSGCPKRPSSIVMASSGW